MARARRRAGRCRFFRSSIPRRGWSSAPVRTTRFPATAATPQLSSLQHEFPDLDGVIIVVRRRWLRDPAPKCSPIAWRRNSSPTRPTSKAFSIASIPMRSRTAPCSSSAPTSLRRWRSKSREPPEFLATYADNPQPRDIFLAGECRSQSRRDLRDDAGIARAPPLQRNRNPNLLPGSQPAQSAC